MNNRMLKMTDFSMSPLAVAGRWITTLAALSTLALAAQVARAADPIPAGRRIDWSTTGVPGGIPNRTNICATFNPGATSSAINSAINACSNGVVKLNAGTYNVTGIDVTKDNVTVRGDGADRTIMNGCNVFRVGAGGNIASSIAITGGGTKDSRTITVGSTSGLAVGTMIEIDRENDPNFVVSTSGGSRHLRQVNTITAINGNTIALRNPLIWDFNAGSPRVKWTFSNTKNSGVEDLKVDHSGTSGCTNFAIWYCDSCWIKGVQSLRANGYHFQILGSVNGELRDSLVHETQTYGNNNGGLQVYGNPSYGSNSSWKIENNIFNKTFPAIELQNSSSGFYLGYNFSYGSGSQSANQPVTWTFMDNHGPHDMMNLWEGNVGEMFGSDGYYGGSSHATVFRNHLTGVNRNSGNTGEPIVLNRLSYSFNIIGNVLGASTSSISQYLQQSEGCSNGVGIYRIGYPNIGNCSLQDVTGLPVPGGMAYPDAKVSSTLLRWGNYDYFNRAARWNAAELPSGVAQPGDQGLPASYIYTSRPSWFGSVPWPAIGPDVSGGTAFGAGAGNVHKIPAQLCWDNRNLAGGGTFSAAACYSSTSVPTPTALQPPTNLRAQ
jgi:hypothetical protein